MLFVSNFNITILKTDTSFDFFSPPKNIHYIIWEKDLTEKEKTRGELQESAVEALLSVEETTLCYHVNSW